MDVNNLCAHKEIVSLNNNKYIKKYKEYFNNTCNTNYFNNIKFNKKPYKYKLRYHLIDSLINDFRKNGKSTINGTLFPVIEKIAKEKKLKKEKFVINNKN